MEKRLSRARSPRAASFALHGNELLGGVRNGVATVTLHRPRALNALSAAMIRGLAEWLEAFAADERVRVVVLRGAGDRAFCAGGDIRAVHHGFRSERRALEEFFRDEYALDHRVHTFPKPIVALIDGIVMGGGMGISQGAALRVVGARTRMAMPETRIGLFPDVGGSYFLSRVPGKLGLYLGLAGATIGAADAICCGLADIHLDPAALERFDGAIERAAAAPDVRAALRAAAERHQAPAPPAEIEALRPAIDEHFGAGSVRRIIASLGREDRPAYRAWAEQTLQTLAGCSPTMLEVTFEALHRGAGLRLADCLRMELNLVHGCFDQRDFLEGIRALSVDKDNRPRWQPASLEAVGRESVEAFFAPRWSASTHPLAHL